MAKESQQNINNQSDEISLKELVAKFREGWQYLSSKWVIILAFGLLGGILGFTYAYLQKPVYTATTSFVLEDEKSGGSGIGNLAGLASIAGIDLGGGGGGIFQGDNILQLYRSRIIIVQTLLSPIEGNPRQLLIDRYFDFNKVRQKWVDNPKLLNLKFMPDSFVNNMPILKPNRLRDSVMSKAVEDIDINYLLIAKPDKKLSTIQVDVKAKDELFAKAFNDALVKNVNEFYINTKTKKTLQNVMILQNKTDSVRSVMHGAIYTATAIADATPNLNPTRQVQRIVPSQTAQFSAETNKVILAELVKNLEMTKMSLLKETPLIQLIDEPIFPLKVKKPSRFIFSIAGALAFCFLTSLYLIFVRNIILTLNKI